MPGRRTGIQGARRGRGGPQVGLVDALQGWAAENRDLIALAGAAGGLATAVGLVLTLMR